MASFIIRGGCCHARLIALCIYVSQKQCGDSPYFVHSRFTQFVTSSAHAALAQWCRQGLSDVTAGDGLHESGFAVKLAALGDKFNSL